MELSAVYRQLPTETSGGQCYPRDISIYRQRPSLAGRTDSRGLYTCLPTHDPDGRLPDSALASPIKESTGLSTPSRSTYAHMELDIVQFSTQIYFVEEDEGVLTVDVIRLGRLKGPVSVTYRTEDGSAKAGQRYEAARGTLEFQDGEFNKTFQVRINQTDYWSATLEFKMVLEDPVNCNLGQYLFLARAKVIDNEMFPSDKYSADLKQGAEGIENISGFGLLFEYFKLNLNVKGIGWRSCLTLLMDQLKNGYLYLTLSLGIYMVDVLFIREEGEKGEDRFPYVKTLVWMFGLPEGEDAWIVGAMYIAPMAVLHIWDFYKVKLDVSGMSRNYLQTSLFRKYLNYSEQSRASVKEAVIHAALVNDTGDLAQSFTAALEILQLLGKLAVLTIFTLRENPDTWWAVVAMPSLLFIFAFCRYKLLLSYAIMAADAEDRLTEIISDTCFNYRLIAAYKQRPKINEVFKLNADQYNAFQIPKDVIILNNNYWSKWLGPLFTGIFVVFSASSVRSGELSLGKFLATIGIFANISSDFSELYRLSMVITSTFNPLKDLTRLLNMETDLRAWKGLNRQRRALTSELRLKVMQEPLPPDGSVQFKTDLIHIMIKDVSFQYPRKELFEDVNISTPQGKLIAVIATHGAGKFTFFEILGSSIFPQKGFVFIPSHLRTLLVSQEPMMLNQSLWRNLTFGLDDPSQADPEIVKQILKSLKMQKTSELLDEERAAGTEDASWMPLLTYTSKVKIHLARALIPNPEVLVLQRPLHHYDVRTRMEVLQQLKSHVRNRGLGMPPESIVLRRPRTVFLTPESVDEARKADVVWQLDDKSKGVVEMSQAMMETQRFDTDGQEFNTSAMITR